jgi:hypothetical protein
MNCRRFSRFHSSAVYTMTTAVRRSIAGVSFAPPAFCECRRRTVARCRKVTVAESFSPAIAESAGSPLGSDLLKVSLTAPRSLPA